MTQHLSSRKEGHKADHFEQANKNYDHPGCVRRNIPSKNWGRRQMSYLLYDIVTSQDWELRGAMMWPFLDNRNRIWYDHIGVKYRSQKDDPETTPATDTSQNDVLVILNPEHRMGTPQWVHIWQKKVCNLPIPLSRIHIDMDHIGYRRHWVISPRSYARPRRCDESELKNLQYHAA